MSRITSEKMHPPYIFFCLVDDLFRDHNSKEENSKWNLMPTQSNSDQMDIFRLESSQMASTKYKRDSLIGEKN